MQGLLRVARQQRCINHDGVARHARPGVQGDREGIRAQTTKLVTPWMLLAPSSVIVPDGSDSAGRARAGMFTVSAVSGARATS